MSPAPPAFPDSVEFARAFYREGVRHLEDARHLCQAGRHAGAITSSMKAAELGVKAVLILENAMGLYEKVFVTHKPLTEVANHVVLKRIIDVLDTHRSNLPVEVQALESLEPTLFGRKGYEAGEANTEYPFLLKVTGPAGNMVVELQSPAAYFGDAEGLRFFRLARELLEALPVLYPVMAAWGVLLPLPL